MGWARRKSNGPAVERFWAAGKKRKRDGVGPAGLKWLRGKRKCFAFSENDSSTVNSNSNSRIQIQTEPQTKRTMQCGMNATQKNNLIKF